MSYPSRFVSGSIKEDVNSKSYNEKEIYWLKKQIKAENKMLVWAKKNKPSRVVWYKKIISEYEKDLNMRKERRKLFYKKRTRRSKSFLYK